MDSKNTGDEVHSEVNPPDLIADAIHGHQPLGARGHFAALAAFVALSLLWFLPLPLHWFDRLPGYGDIWLTTWNFWWMKKALLDLGVSPWYSDWVFWPQGVDLSLHALSPLNSLVAIPLQLLGGIPFAYNTIFLAAFALSGYAVFLVVHDLTGDRAASFFGGYVFAFSPYHWSHLHHLEHLSIQWPAFLLWAWLRARRHAFLQAGPACRWMTAAAAFHVVAAGVNPYLGLFSVLLVVLASVRDLLAFRRRAVLPWLTYVLVAGVGLMPLGLVMARAALAEGQFQVPLWVKIHQSIDLLALVTPSPNNPLVRDWFPLMPLYRTFTAGESIGYVGWSVLALTVVSALRSPCRDRRFLLIGALVFVLMAMGPVLHVAGIVRLWDGMPVPLPQGILQVLPVVSAARVPARYLSIAMLFFAVASAVGLAALRATRARPERMTALFFCFLVLEYWNAPFAATRPEYPAYTQHLAADSRDIAVLELPFRISSDRREWWRSVDPGDQGWRQALHGKRSLTGSVSHTALQARHFRFFLESPLLAPLVSWDTRLVAKTSREALEAERSRLRLAYLVLHKQTYARMLPFEMERDRTYIRDVLAGIPSFEDAEVEVWTVDSKAGPPAPTGDSMTAETRNF